MSGELTTQVMCVCGRKRNKTKRGKEERKREKETRPLIQVQAKSICMKKRRGYYIL